MSELQVDITPQAVPEVEVTITAPQKKKRVRTKSSDPNAVRRYYFTSDTQDAIVAYQNAQTKQEREQLFVTRIQPAFQKLVENLINIHKFKAMHDSYDDMLNDCVNFLFETISKFDADRGTNAFSYFNVVAKNWLIIKTKQRQTRLKRSVSISDHDSLGANEQRLIDEYSLIPSQDELYDALTAGKDTIELLYDIRTSVKTENELLCINAIITIFENVAELDLLNKGAILLYLRDLSGLGPKQLTMTMQSIRKSYRKICTERQKLNDYPGHASDGTTVVDESDGSDGTIVN